jgi:hypothetical protein
MFWARRLQQPVGSEQRFTDYVYMRRPTLFIDEQVSRAPARSRR